MKIPCFSLKTYKKCSDCDKTLYIFHYEYLYMSFDVVDSVRNGKCFCFAVLSMIHSWSYA